MSDGMKKTVKTEHLELGMYVILGVPWYKHPFVKGEFILKEEDQIQQIFDSNIEEVIVDPEKSIVIENERTSARIQTNKDKPSIRTNLPNKSREVSRGERVPVQEKLIAIQKHSEDQRKASEPQREQTAKPLSANVVPGESKEAVPEAKIPAREKPIALQNHYEDQRKASGPQREQTAKPLSVSVVPDESGEVSRGERLPVGEKLKLMQKHSEVQQKASEPQPEQISKPLSRTIVPDELREAIHNAKLPPQEKAKAVQAHSVTMIRNLLDNPTAGNISDTKKVIADVVDLILTDDATSLYLLSITSHDFYTYTHSVNVGFLSVLLSKALFKKSTGHDMHELGAGFFLHDLGKVNIDPAIINKPGKLTEEEMTKMKQHPDIGYKVLYETNQLTHECKKIVMQHHERYDGKGYPLGLKGDEIHLYGRICSVADVFDALTSDRPYRQKLKPFPALKLMKEQMIEHFHKELFDKFVFLFTN
jgi:HD-GYP domain-containing protein (c-di-GMP phosphodiesterase class II)